MDRNSSSLKSVGVNGVFGVASVITAPQPTPASGASRCKRCKADTYLNSYTNLHQFTPETRFAVAHGFIALHQLHQLHHNNIDTRGGLT